MLRKIVKSFFKIGAIGFGGGSALIPIVEKEIVEDNGYITAEQYTDHTIVSNITPGALPVKLGQLIGYDMGGVAGMTIGAFMTSVPGVLIMLLILSFLQILGDGFVEKINYASVGISTFIIFLLIMYIKKVLKDSSKNSFKLQAWFLMLSTAILTMGKEIRHIFHTIELGGEFSSATPLLDISTIDVLLLVFFLIFFTGGKFSKIRGTVAAVISIIYIISFGKSPVIHMGWFGSIFKLGIMVAAIILTVLDAKKEASGNDKIKLDVKGAVIKSIPFILISALLVSVCMIFTKADVGYFTSNGIVSSVTSFGGGEAYLTVADGIFVSEGVVSTSEFYGKILPVANALPGSILVKILSGVGFSIGSQTSMAEGWMLALLGFALATMASCVVCVWVQMIYKGFSNLSIFNVLKIWVLPVICGLLISTILSMLNEMLKISSEAGMTHTISGIFIALIFAVVYFLHKKFNLHDLILIAGSAIISLGVYMII